MTGRYMTRQIALPYSPTRAFLIKLRRSWRARRHGHPDRRGYLR